MENTQTRIPAGFKVLQANFPSSSIFPLFFQDRPQEKPICIFISNLEQLRAAAPPISPLLWEFMENVYPGGIGCIIQKGEWLKKLGEMRSTALLSPFHVFSRAGLQSQHLLGCNGERFQSLSPRNPPWSSRILGGCLAEGVNQLE